MTLQEQHALEDLAQAWFLRSALRLEDSESEPTITTQRKLLYGAQCTMRCGTELLAQTQGLCGAKEIDGIVEKWRNRVSQRLDDAKAEPTPATRARLEYGANCTWECLNELERCQGLQRDAARDLAREVGLKNIECP